MHEKRKPGLGRPPRLKQYDYSSTGAYFLTIVGARSARFSHVRQARSIPTLWGSIVKDEWFRSAQLRLEISLAREEFILMPNHLHGIVWIDSDRAAQQMHQQVSRDRAKAAIAPARSLIAFVAGFKAAVTRRIRMLTGDKAVQVWQRGYYEHVIRSERALQRIRRYMRENPLHWTLERENPDAILWDEDGTL